MIKKYCIALICTAFILPIASQAHSPTQPTDTSHTTALPSQPRIHYTTAYLLLLKNGVSGMDVQTIGNLTEEISRATPTPSVAAQSPTSTPAA